jgi:beta-phosphoglucomutase-like phosphatase (HAD superfamily)
MEIVMYRAALFDMDGLIFDTERSIKSVWQNAAQLQSLNIDDSFYSKFIGVKDVECEDMLKRHFLNTDFSLDKFIFDRDRLMAAKKRNTTEIKRGFDTLFHHLLDQQVKLALVTSSSLSQVQHHFKGYHYLSSFKVIVTGDDVVNGKPNPECYIRAIQALNVKAEQCIVFEDSNNGMRAGLAAKCDCVMVPDLTIPSHTIREKATAILSSLEQAIPLFTTTSK